MKQYAIILPVISGIMFGSVGVFVRKLSEYGMSNGTILFVRVLGAFLLMFLFLLCKDKSKLKIKCRDLPLFLGTGIIGMMGLNLCYNIAIKSLTLSFAAILLGIAPIFAVIMAAFIFKEKVTLKKIICMAMALCGCIFASGIVGDGIGTISVIGIVSGITAAIFYAFYSIFSRLATDKKYHTYTVIFYSVALITIVMFPFAEKELISSFVMDFPIKNIAFLIAHSLCTSVVPYVFITLALQYVEAGTVSILASGGEPVAAVVFGMVFYMEIPSFIMVLGIAITLIALTYLCILENESHNNPL